jgi:SAM-dependent methyltransferase
VQNTRVTNREPLPTSTSTSTSTSTEYGLGHSTGETRRLMLQHQIYAPITRRLFEAAGIGAGMRVLDVGSGAGDVALLLADLVGPHGAVVGFDVNASILNTARARAEAGGLRNVTFYAGDAASLPPNLTFDAIVGRWILMHLPDPVGTLRALVETRLRPGGIVAFQESDFGYPPASFPRSDLVEQVSRWGAPPDLGESGGPRMRMGMELFATFLDAGLPAPQLRLDGAIGGGADWPGYEYVAETMRSLLPALERMTGLDPDEVEIDTLEDRLREDAVSGRRVMVLPITIGAWAPKPAR